MWCSLVITTYSSSTLWFSHDNMVNLESFGALIIACVFTTYLICTGTHEYPEYHSDAGTGWGGGRGAAGFPNIWQIS